MELAGVGEPHAAFLTESRTREPVGRRVQEIRVARLFRPTYALANVGHPSHSYWVLLGRRLLHSGRPSYDDRSLRTKRFRRVDAGDPEGRQNRREKSDQSE